MARYTRADWHAEPPRSVTPLPWSRVDELYVHYTAAHHDRDGDPRIRLRSIQKYHRHTKGWADVAYNQAFSDEGHILEGRGWEVMSAATYGRNGRSQAVVFLGADKEGRDDVTDAGRRALGVLIREAIAAKKAAGGGYLMVKGHREAVNTDCPGEELMAYIRARGWELDEAWPRPLPRWFWRFAEWWLGEGKYRTVGPRARKHRPAGVPRRIPAWAWVRLRIMLRRRKR